ncbi:P-loop containing nucleoside triphosphate hydrolase protein [Mycena leptocephala]|nr:P-loop containing nucleoside triphosphate hydrolase protein [Mycena leptocephala]
MISRPIHPSEMQTTRAASRPKGNTSEILKYATIAAEILRDLAQTSHVPFLQDAAGASLLLFGEIHGMKTNQGTLLRIVGLVHQILCAVVHICLEESRVLPVKILDDVGYFVKTVQKIQTSVQLQQELGKIKRFIRQNEIGIRLRTYETELQAILEHLKIRTGGSLPADLVELESNAQRRHEELLALLGSQDDGKSSEYPVSFRGSNSSSIFSVLPPLPKIFHGRDPQLMLIVTTMQIQPAYLAILGPGGMGKTTLAIATLHHPEIISKYDQRHFISCESAFQHNQLLNIIGVHLHLEPSKQLLKSIIDHFLNCGSTLLVLDNLETAWEDEGRAEVEELLSLLSDVPQLSLLITMRGAERPAKVKWTRPFLPPLEPLDPSASRQTFIDIADEPSGQETEDLDVLLKLSGNLPLAVSLMAAVASHEGYSNTLRRWKIENTALLSNGYDKRSNLEKSIAISLSSPRMLSLPHAKDLLSLVSLLPDGLDEVDLLSRDAVDIPNILHARAALLRISLAYMEHGRLKTLSPIRQYMQRVFPPPCGAVERLRGHWDSLLMLWKSHKELAFADLVSRLTSNLGNIEIVTQIALSRMVFGAERWQLMRSVLSLDLFSQNVLKGRTPLAHHVVEHIQSSGDQQLHWEHICSCLMSQTITVLRRLKRKY